MCTHMCMTTKNVSIMEDVYKLLVARKKENESFSDVIRKEFGKRRDIMEFAGAWKNVGDKEIEEMKKNIELIGMRATQDLIRRVKK